MAIQYGVTANGFVVKNQDTCQTELLTALQAIFGNGLDTSPQSNIGQLAGVLSEREADLWALAAAVDAALTPEGATGTAQDSINSLTGVIRLVATASTVELSYTGNSAATIGTSNAASIPGAGGTQWVPLVPVTLALAPSWARNTVYSVGQVVTNAGLIWSAATSGTSASTGSGPTSAGLAVVDGTNGLTWTTVGSGTYFAQTEAQCTITGPNNAPAYAINTIVNAVSGWLGVFNLGAALPGTNVETDSAYRLRRDEDLGQNGDAFLNAIEAAVARVPGVTNVVVFENYTDVTSGDGIPPHAVECLVTGGDNLAVATAIFGSIAAGIQPFGQTNTVTETVVDSVGNSHTIQFSRPTQVTINVTANITVSSIKDASIQPFPATGQAQVADAIAAFVNGLGGGINVVASALASQCFTIPGMLDAQILIAVSPTVPSGSATITIMPRQVATCPLGAGGVPSSVTVNVTVGTP